MPAGVSAYVALANVTLASAATTVILNSIDQTHRDLVLVIQSRQGIGGAETFVRFNGDSSNVYTFVNGYGLGSGTPGAGSAATVSRVAPSTTVGESTSNSSFVFMNIMDYSQVDKHKMVLLKSHDIAQSGLQMQGSRWANTNAITSITISSYGGEFAAGSAFTLYGVSA